MYLFKGVLASLDSGLALFEGLDDSGNPGDFVKKFELAIEEGVGRPVEAFDDRRSAKIDRSVLS